MATVVANPDTAEPLPVGTSASGRVWRWRAGQLPLHAAAGLGLSDLSASLFLSRGCDAADIDRLCRPTLRDWLPDPSIFTDMDRAAARLADAIAAGESICVFADYDVDGATSAATLIRALRLAGADPSHYIPDRLLEGYGPGTEALLRLARAGTRLVVVLDCGTQAFEPLAAAAAAGLDVIVVDHHKASAALPAVHALVNPNRLDETAAAAGFAMLCTAGLSFLLAVALWRTLRARGWFAARGGEPSLSPLLEIVALGTVADVVPLVGLNRALVALGVRRMADRSNPGIRALFDIAGHQRPPAAEDLGFVLGPRINAGGRVGRADLGVRLLATDDAAEAARLAAELDRHNLERRAIEQQVTDAALRLADTQGNAAVALVSGAGWHPGVVGIVAARLKERLGRPAFVLAESADGLARGSGRSVEGVDLGAAVLSAREAGLLVAGGGHAMAAGLTVEIARIGELAAYLDARLGAAASAATQERSLAIDVATTPRGFTLALAEALDAAGPYGQGWPAPRVAVGPVSIVRADAVGRTEPREHLRFVARGPDGGTVAGVAFRAASGPLGAFLQGAGPDRRLHLAGRIQINRFGGREAAELLLDDAAEAR
jgi:single-stranded-DNA-specific exonuclease